MSNEAIEKTETKDPNAKKENRRKLLIVLLIIGILICIGITIWAVFFRSNDAADTDYPQKKIEQNQKPIEGDNSEKMDSPEGGGAINVTYSTEITASLSENKVTLYYANPYASNQNVSIQVMVDEVVIAESDLINPGNQVTELTLKKEAKSQLKAGGYDAQIVVQAYHPESGEKSMVDTKGEVSLIVVE